MSKGYKGHKGYKGRAIVPRPGGPMRDRKKAASKRAARGWRQCDYPECGFDGYGYDDE